MSDDLKVIEGLRDRLHPDSLKMMENLKTLRERIDTIIEFEQIQAKLIRTKFEALVKEGFTEVQAMELCKK